LPAGPWRRCGPWQATPLVGGDFALRFDGDDALRAVLGAAYAVQRRLGFYYGIRRCG
jgi:hypothetical protein